MCNKYNSNCGKCETFKENILGLIKAHQELGLKVLQPKTLDGIALNGCALIG